MQCFEPRTLSRIQSQYGEEIDRIQGENVCLTKIQNLTFVVKQIQRFQILSKCKSFWIQKKIFNQFKHKNVIVLQGYFQIGKKAVKITKYLKNGTLANANLKILTKPQKFKIVSEIGQFLREFHHKGYIHRDVTPKKILMYGITPKFFNFTSSTQDKGCSLQQSKVGGALYCHPSIENLLYSKQVDLFSFALIIYFVFSGKNLFVSKKKQDLKIQKQKFINNYNTEIQRLNIDQNAKDIMKELMKAKSDNYHIIEEQILNKIKAILQESKNTIHCFSKIQSFVKQYIKNKKKQDQKQKEKKLLKKLITAKKNLRKIELLQIFNNIHKSVKYTISFIIILSYQAWLIQLRKLLKQQFYTVSILQSIQIKQLDPQFLKNIQKYIQKQINVAIKMIQQSAKEIIMPGQSLQKLIQKINHGDIYIITIQQISQEGKKIAKTSFLKETKFQGSELLLLLKNLEKLDKIK